MNKFVVYVVIAVWTFKTSSVYGNLNITQSGSNIIGSTTYTLACQITGYASLATWDRGTIMIGQCPVGGCLASTDSRYSFRNDAGAIYVDFVKLESNEDGVVWTCKHGFDPPDVFTVVVDESTVPSSSNGFTDGQKAGLSVGLLFFVFAVAVIIYLVIKKWKDKPAPINNSAPVEPKTKLGNVPDEPKPKPGNVPVEPEPKPVNDKLPSITRHDPVELESMLGNDKPSSIKRHDKLPSIKRNGDPEPRQVHESA